MNKQIQRNLYFFQIGNFYKLIIGLICSIGVCCIGVLQVHASVKVDFVVDGIRYNNYEGDEKAAQYDDKQVGVTSIKDKDLVEQTLVKDGVLTIPANVTYNNQEYEVVNVDPLDLPENVETLKITNAAVLSPQNVTNLIVGGSEIFAYDGDYPMRRENYSKLESIEINAPNLTLTSRSMMYYPNLSEVTFSENMELKLSGRPFCYNQKLKHIALPAKTTGIENGFFRCKNLKEISFFSESDNYEIIDGSVFTREEDPSLALVPSNVKDYEVPKNVIEIKRSAFSNCKKLSTVKLHKNLLKIGDYAFYGSKLKSIQIPRTVKEIGTGVFQKNSKLSTITVEKGNKYFTSNGKVLSTKREKSVVAAIPVKGVCTIPEGIKVIELDFITNMDKVKKIIFPKSLTTWKDDKDYCAKLTYSFKGSQPPERIAYEFTSGEYYVDFCQLDDNGNEIKGGKEARIFILPKKYVKKYKKWLKK